MHRHTLRLLLALTSPGLAAEEPVQRPLRHLAEEAALHIGVAVATGPFSEALQSEEPSAWTDLLASQFNILTAENAMKFGNVSPRSREHDWALADAMFDFADANEMAVRYHTGLWHRQNPSWTEDAELSAEALTEIARWHITAIGQRYGHRMTYWDVINEPIDAGQQPGHLRDTIWRRAIGPDYLAVVYRWAHEAAPDAKLVVNDYGVIGGGAKADALYEVVRDLADRGVPVHAVGFQVHLLDGKAPGATAITANLQRFADLDLEVHITEMDVASGPLQHHDDPLQRQAEIYGQVLTAALKVPRFTVFQTWGLTDQHTWVAGLKNDQSEAPLLFDRQRDPKPAYRAVRDALLQAAEHRAGLRHGKESSR